MLQIPFLCIGYNKVVSKELTPMTIREGNIVVRRSYAGDIFFVVVDIYKDVALLKGVSHRLMADAPLVDLILVSECFELAKEKLTLDR